MEARIQLEQQLKRLKMPGVLHALDLRVAEAQQSGLGYLEFLSLLIDDEMQSRENNMLAKRLKAAAFGVQQTFEQFDFRFNEQSLPPATLRDLATCRFIDQRRNVVIGGPPGIGKTHAVKALIQFAFQVFQIIAITAIAVRILGDASLGGNVEMILRGCATGFQKGSDHVFGPAHRVDIGRVDMRHTVFHGRIEDGERIGFGGGTAEVAKGHGTDTETDGKRSQIGHMAAFWMMPLAAVFNMGDGTRDGIVDGQIGRVELHCVVGRGHGRVSPAAVACVAGFDIGQHGLVIRGETQL